MGQNVRNDQSRWKGQNGQNDHTGQNGQKKP